MALVARYKLNGNANDEFGVYNATTVDANISWTDGKTGLAATQTNTSTDGIQVENFPQLRGEFTVNFWYRQDSFPAAFVQILSRMQGDAPNQFTIRYHNNGTSMQFYYGNGSAAFVISLDRTLMIPNSGEWVMITYSKEIGTDTITRIYSNGVQVASRTDGGPRRSAEVSFPLRIWSVGSPSAQGAMSDLRIYDHALSVAEIKELYKAPIFHLLAQPVYESTINYIPNPSFREGTWPIVWNSGICAVSLVSTYGNNTPVCRVELTGTGNGGAQTAYAFSVPSGQIVTLSMDIRGTTAELDYAYLMRQSNSNSAFPDVILDNADGIFWNRISTTLTNNTADICGILVGINGNAGEWIEFTNVQLEFSDHKTPFVDGTRTETIIDDTGFSGNINMPSENCPQYVQGESPIGSGYFKFSDGRNFTVPNFPYIRGSTTISFWVRLATTSVRQTIWNKGYSGEGTINHETDGTLNYYFGENGNNTTGQINLKTSVLPLNQWLHVAAVRDLESDLMLWYVDGVQNTTRSGGGRTFAGESNSITLQIGTGYTDGFIGDLTDVKSFATALSPDDIYREYINRASLYKNGQFVSKMIDNSSAYIQLQYPNRVVGTPFNIISFDEVDARERYYSEIYMVRSVIANSSVYHEYDFIIEDAGNYSIDAFILAPSGSNDSYFMGLDGAAVATWFIVNGPSWKWDNWTTTFLAAGKHTLRVAPREKTKMSSIRIVRTSDSLTAKQVLTKLEKNGSLITNISEIGPTESLEIYLPLNGNIVDYAGNYVTSINGTENYELGYGQTDSFGTVYANSHQIQWSMPTFDLAIDSLTILAWVYIPPSITWDYGAQDMAIVTSGTYSGSIGIGVGNASNTLRCQLRPPTGSSFAHNFSINRDTWYLLALSYDHFSNNVLFYCNGETSSTTVTTFWQSETLWRVGGYIPLGGGSNSNGFEGRVQWIQVHRASLTEAELNNLYNLHNVNAPTKLQQSKSTMIGRNFKEI